MLLQGGGGASPNAVPHKRRVRAPTLAAPACPDAISAAVTTPTAASAPSDHQSAVRPCCCADAACCCLQTQGTRGQTRRALLQQRMQRRGRGGPACIQCTPWRSMLPLACADSVILVKFHKRHSSGSKTHCLAASGSGSASEDAAAPTQRPRLCTIGRGSAGIRCRGAAHDVVDAVAPFDAQWATWLPTLLKRATRASGRLHGTAVDGNCMLPVLWPIGPAKVRATGMMMASTQGSEQHRGCGSSRWMELRFMR